MWVPLGVCGVAVRKYVSLWCGGMIGLICSGQCTSSSQVHSQPRGVTMWPVLKFLWVFLHCCLLSSWPLCHRDGVLRLVVVDWQVGVNSHLWRWAANKVSQGHRSARHCWWIMHRLHVKLMWNKQFSSTAANYSIYFTGRLTNGKIFDSATTGYGLEFKLGKKELMSACVGRWREWCDSRRNGLQ